MKKLLLALSSLSVVSATNSVVKEHLDSNEIVQKDISMIKRNLMLVLQH